MSNESNLTGASGVPDASASRLAGASPERPPAAGGPDFHEIGARLEAAHKQVIGMWKAKHGERWMGVGEIHDMWARVAEVGYRGHPPLPFGQDWQPNELDVRQVRLRIERVNPDVAHVLTDEGMGMIMLAFADYVGIAELGAPQPERPAHG